MENPKIRFKGFTKDWEQRKLGDDLVSIHTGTNLLGSITNTGMPLIKMGNIQRGYFDTSKVEFLAENEQPDKADIVNYGDFFFNTRNTLELVGKGATWMKNSGEYAFNSNIARFELRNLDTIFFNYLYNTDYMTKQIHARAMGTTSVAAIYPRTLDSVEYLAPCMKEQQKIGAYFKQLDHLITLHQRKCEQTKNLKKYMLQKMFPQNGAKVPEIRFNGFTHDWEQRKLSDVLDIVTKRNGEKYGKEEVLSVSDEYGCINQIKFQGRSFAGEDISNYKIVDTGDIIYTRSPLKSKPYGIIKVVGDEIGIVSPLYIVNKVKEGNNSQFIYRVFDSPEKTNKYLSPLVRKGAKNTMNISNDEWLSGKIDVAPSYEEQYQIGLYFDHLDNLITLHQRQCDELKKMKKYMLQNMFI